MLRIACSAVGFLAVAFVLIVFAFSRTAFAGDNFPIAGTYMQNVPCKGDGTDNPALRVKISSKEIISNVGICTILDARHDGDSTTAHVECKFPAGPLVGDITFTQRPDKTLKFVDRDNTYNAILHRCPD